MFGKKEDTTVASVSNTLDNLNKIVKGTIIDGNIKAETDIRIDGKINGNIKTAGKLVQGSTSEIIGDIDCIQGSIEGFVRGNINVRETLRIAKTANVDGNINTGKLIVEEGAIIQAKISMSNGSSSPSSNVSKNTLSAKS